MADKIKYAFRITHIANIPHIQKFGILRANSPLCSDDFVSIGDTKVIDCRREVVRNNVRISDCVPFYFGPRSPMLYVIQNGYNGVQRQAPQNIVYCVVRIADIISGPLDCIFSDGHALNAISRFYGKEHLNDINHIIRYDDVYAQRWNNNENDLDIKRRKEAELLICGDLPVDLICGYVVYNDRARDLLKSMGIAADKIVVAPNYYF